jgi:hypothetical protein
MQRVMWLLLVTVIVTTFATGHYFVGMVATAAQIFVLDVMTFVGALRLPPD